MRRTQPLVKIATVLLARPNNRHWGYSLSRESGVRSGVLYPMLSRLLEAGYVEDGWEERAPGGRPSRRYYRLTPLGQSELLDIVEAGQK